MNFPLRNIDFQLFDGTLTTQRTQKRICIGAIYRDCTPLLRIDQVRSYLIIVQNFKRTLCPPFPNHVPLTFNWTDVRAEAGLGGSDACLILLRLRARRVSFMNGDGVW